MNITARPYQAECVKAMFSSMRQGEEFGLVSIPTGGGKTIIFSLFVQEVFRRYAREGRRIRVGIISHREQLVGQSRDKLLRVWPESAPKIGLACSSFQKDVDIDSEIIIGSIQTMTRRMQNRAIEPFNILLIDEAHRIPSMDKGASDYASLIRVSGELRRERKIFGFTATPYRLGHGYIYGEYCKKGSRNWFPRLTYSLTMDEMIASGYLVPFRIKQAMDIGPDLRSVPIVNGEYKNDALGTIMCRFSETALAAWREYGEDRKKNVVFCANIEHAENVARTFRDNGLAAASVHSGLSMPERKRRLEDFSKGELNFLTSVDALSEGWDETGIDCILMLRPTKSPMVYVQQAGRGLRPHEGKKDLLVLDMADNTVTHGFFSNPIVVIPKSGEGGGEAPTKICPGTLPNGAICNMILHASIMKCPECGYEFPKKRYKEPGRLKFQELSRENGDYSFAHPVPAKIVRAEIEQRENFTAVVFHYVDSYSKRGKAWYFINPWMPGSEVWEDEWRKLSGLEKYPQNMDELLALLPEAEWPEHFCINKQNERRYAAISWFILDNGDEYEPIRSRKRPAQAVCRPAGNAGPKERRVFEKPKLMPLGSGGKRAEQTPQRRGMIIGG